MLNQNALTEAIQEQLSDLDITNRPLRWQRDLSGGDINRAALIGDGRTSWFLKYHQNAPTGMFEAESDALEELAALDCIHVPGPVAYGRTASVDWLLIEYLEMPGSGSDAQLGEQLAMLHSKTFTQYGWHRNNFIGITPQDNQTETDWLAFWRNRRIKPQLDMARANGFAGRLQTDGERLLENMGALLEDHQPSPSLLHGDLWAGNKSFTRDGQPVIYDPASYYGDRETDIAMTELFGGFSTDFYRAYEAILPLPTGYRLRRDLYNLYHVLNHLNLFGRGYLGRSENLISGLLAHTH